TFILTPDLFDLAARIGDGDLLTATTCFESTIARRNDYASPPHPCRDDRAIFAFREGPTWLWPVHALFNCKTFEFDKLFSSRFHEARQIEAGGSQFLGSRLLGGGRAEIKHQQQCARKKQRTHHGLVPSASIMLNFYNTPYRWGIR